MPDNPLDHLLSLLRSLDGARAPYRLNSVRDAVLVEVASPGVRWEVEFFAEGAVEVERFVSVGSMGGSEAIADLLAAVADER